MTTVRTAEDLGRVIHARRRDLGYTQQQLAERVGVTRQWIVAVEKGRERAELGPVLRLIFQLNLDLRLEQPLEQTPDTLDLERYVQSFVERGGPSAAARARHERDSEAP